MEAALDASDRPAWTKHFTTIDDRPESVHGKTGKRRPRVDVCVSCIYPRPTRRFRFEAKRLNASASLSRYLGEDGMLALITGHYGDLPRAGMIGYVQTDTCSVWGEQIKAAIVADPMYYCAARPVEFVEMGFALSEAVFQSAHEHGSPAVSKRITHTLLQCS